MEFSRQEYWNGLPFPSPEDLPNPGIEPGSPALQADALPSETPGKPLEARNKCHQTVVKSGSIHLNCESTLLLHQLQAAWRCLAA